MWSTGKGQIGEAVITRQVCCLPEGEHSFFTVGYSVPESNLFVLHANYELTLSASRPIAVYTVDGPDGANKYT